MKDAQKEHYFQQTPKIPCPQGLGPTQYKRNNIRNLNTRLQNLEENIGAVLIDAFWRSKNLVDSALKETRKVFPDY